MGGQRQSQAQDHQEKRKEMTLDSILSTIVMVICDSDNIDFQTRCYAELGTSNRAEIANILACKLSSMK